MKEYMLFNLYKEFRQEVMSNEWNYGEESTYFTHLGYQFGRLAYWEIKNGKWTEKDA